jgi:hypothetical protein
MPRKKRKKIDRLLLLVESGLDAEKILRTSRLKSDAELKIKMSSEEKEEMRKLAKLAGISMTQWLLECHRAAYKNLHDKGLI